MRGVEGIAEAKGRCGVSLFGAVQELIDRDARHLSTELVEAEDVRYVAVRRGDRITNCANVCTTHRQFEVFDSR